MFGFNDKIKTFCWGHYIAKMCMDYCLVSMHLYSRATKIDTLYICTVLLKNPCLF